MIPMGEPIEAEVLDEKRPAVCRDCDAPITLQRLRVTAPARCAGILLWAIPRHLTRGRVCPGRSCREAGTQ